MRDFLTSGLLTPLSPASPQLRSSKKFPRTLEESVLEVLASSASYFKQPNSIQNSFSIRAKSSQFFKQGPKSQQSKVGAQTQERLQPYLFCHEFTSVHRARLLDWMVQVFRVFKVSSVHTFFLAVSLLDRYCAAKAHTKHKLMKNELHEIGLSVIFLSSKYEDVIPIHMD